MFASSLTSLWPVTYVLLGDDVLREELDVAHLIATALHLIDAVNVAVCAKSPWASMRRCANLHRTIFWGRTYGLGDNTLSPDFRVSNTESIVAGFGLSYCLYRLGQTISQRTIHEVDDALQGVAFGHVQNTARGLGGGGRINNQV